MKVMLKEKKKIKLRKQKKNHPKKKEKSFLQQESNPRPLKCEVILISIAPQHQVFNICIKLIIFNIFAHKILPVDVVWSW